MFHSTALRMFFETHKDLPHISIYHREGYKEHCLLVFDEMSKMTDDSTLLVAAALHDIAKPRTQALNKRGEPCFYGHEQLTDDEIAVFLTKDDPRFEYVKGLIWCHMLPYNLRVADGKDFDEELKKACEKLLKKHEIDVEVDDDFMSDLDALHSADDDGSVRHDDELVGIDKRCKRALTKLEKLR